MRDWLHQHCSRGDKRTPVDNPTLPKRLLKVGTITDPVRLIATNHKAGSYEYALLSYCWGGDQSGKTTVDNLQLQEAGISAQNISASVRDAIWVTRVLGLEYLWVDALCKSDLETRTELTLLMPHCRYRSR